MGWPWTTILLISASQVAKITGISHWWYWGLNSGPTLSHFFVMSFFKIGSYKLFPQSGFELPSSWIFASWVARTTGMNHWHPAHQPFFFPVCVMMVFFKIESSKLFAWGRGGGWLQMVILLISASRVARIIGMSHQCLAQPWNLFWFLWRILILVSLLLLQLVCLLH
jgi:hypothetical protein